jgi:hypothetical protein
MMHLGDVKSFHHLLIFAVALIKVHAINKRICLLERRLHIEAVKK